MPQHDRMPSMSWLRFALMIAASVAVMFLLMYQLVYSADHAHFSLNRLLASIVMGGVMTLLMLGFMWRMYEGLATKVAVLAAGLAVAVGGLALNRSQALVGDGAFMSAMIPHHSIAINNARKARISDPRVRRLADRIIANQVREIEEMKLLLDDIAERGERGGDPLPARAAEVTPDMLPKIMEAVR